MAEPAIQAVGLWKRFHRGEVHDSLRDLVPSIARHLLGKAPKPTQLQAGDFWALRDINFNVRPGEALGIIGPNGAGKSTMLKLLTRILRPTLGTCTVHGRVGALIEVAAGFHPDLTGMENIYLQGSIMGMRSFEIAQKIDQIIEFAGVADFIHTPVKRYSSGMHARLGFAVAAHLDPDVLIIDEVLSVGDMQFQERCIERMKYFKKNGVAIAFVSHNMQAVAELCDTGIYLSGGIVAKGPVQDAIATYVRSASRQVAAPQGAAIDIIKADLMEDGGGPAVTISPGDGLILRVTYQVHEAMKNFHLIFMLVRSTDGLKVYDGFLRSEDLGLDSVSAGETFSVDFRFRAHLSRGQYHIGAYVYHNPTFSRVSYLLPAGLFSVQESITYGGGVADLELQSGDVVRNGPGPR